MTRNVVPNPPEPRVRLIMKSFLTRLCFDFVARQPKEECVDSIKGDSIGIEAGGGGAGFCGALLGNAKRLALEGSAIYPTLPRPTVPHGVGGLPGLALSSGGEG